MTTRKTDFFPLREGRTLFSVNDGIPAQIAIEEAGILASTAHDTLRSGAHGLSPGEDATLIWSACFLLEQVCALLDSLGQGIQDEIQGAPDKDAQEASA